MEREERATQRRRRREGGERGGLLCARASQPVGAIAIATPSIAFMSAHGGRGEVVGALSAFSLRTPCARGNEAELPLWFGLCSVGQQRRNGKQSN